jgi:hypothetical protein
MLSFFCNKILLLQNEKNKIKKRCDNVFCCFLFERGKGK